MLDMLKSKMMIGFMVFVVGITYMNTLPQKNYEENHQSSEIMMEVTK